MDNHIFDFYERPVSNVHRKRTATLSDIHKYITTDYNVVETTRYYRQMLLRVERGETPKTRAANYKRTMFDFVTFSGTFSIRRDDCLIHHSGLICLDFDKLGNRVRLDCVRQQLLHDPYLTTRLLFTSPSGDGLKWVVDIDLSRGTHEKWYRAIANYMHSAYGLEADPQCANVSRGCFLPHDPDCYFNQQD